MIRLSVNEIENELKIISKRNGFNESKSSLLAAVFAENNLLGKESHGLNRFPSFIKSVKDGNVKVEAEPELISSFNALEQWDGNLGAGHLNAVFCTDRAIILADKFGIGCVTLRNTNHWMRGGTYGWNAAGKGYVFICWTNAIPTMPAWGSSEPKLGNNPLVIAVPHEPDPIVLDMALSQYSYGVLEVMARRGKELKYYGGFNNEGELTKNPEEILNSRRALPIGLWKGSGLSLILDIIAASMSAGKSSGQIGKQDSEFGVSQIFIALKPPYEGKNDYLEKMVNDIVDDFHSSLKISEEKILYPGEQSFMNKQEHLKNGIPVDKELWERIQNL